MGIRGFRAWFESEFPDAVKAVNKEKINDAFDHVLIDVNPLIHVCLRKSRSDGHSLVLLMKTLDDLVEFATPKMSLVLAMDGPPGAAKLSTQRKRRFTTVVRSNLKIKQIDKLLKSDSPISRRAKKRITSWKRKRQRLVSDLRTMRLTPGTDYMERAERAVLYWAWQRLNSRSTTLSSNRVSVFVSSSTSPGEGEVKLLEWIYTKPRRGESIACVGGDSDLVLEALVVPVASTHNVFVLLPEGTRHVLCVSMWEVARTLARRLHHDSIVDIIKVRSDLALMLMMTGNDYFPKLKGSGGFNRLFRTYMKLHRGWEDRSDAYLVDPATLRINFDFAIAYFKVLAAVSASAPTFKRRQENTSSTSPLSKLNNLVAAGFFPSPCVFLVVGEDEGDIPGKTTEIAENRDEDDLDSDEDDEIDDDDDGEEFDLVSEPDEIRVRLLLGEPGSEDFFSYEIRHPQGTSLRKAKHTLAAMALTDMLDEEEDSENSEDGVDGTTLEDDLTAVASTYDWNVQHPVEGDVSMYLYGVLWNLQTYQTGKSLDYGYNYGKRLAPHAKDIADFLQTAQAQGRSITPNELQSPVCTKPFGAGISCLAALPSLISDLVPLPFRELPPATVEEFYGNCMDPKNNTFDFIKFEHLCLKKLESMGLEAPPPAEEENWTVLSKTNKPLSNPTTPPPSFSHHLDELPASRYIRLNNTKNLRSSHTPGEVDPGPFLSKLGTVERVDYRLAYQTRQERKAFRSRKNKARSPAVKHAPSENLETESPARVSNKHSNTEVGSDDKTSAPNAMTNEDFNNKQSGIGDKPTVHSSATTSTISILSEGTTSFAEGGVPNANAISELIAPHGAQSSPTNNGSRSTQEKQFTKESATKILYLLADIQLIEIEWSIVSAPMSETIRLTIKKGATESNLTVPSNQFVLEAQREMQVAEVESRRLSKLRLASDALDILTGSKNWQSMTLKQLRKAATVFN